MPESPDAPYKPTAPYMRIVAELTEEIRAGKYAPGERIPSEHELCARFGVARETARRAVAALRDRGLIETEWGRGSRVVAPPAGD
ncbi:GntR family transcriptional regulator, phosphonate transport system regulatory protein/GntR family transcriptional regulator, trehalose operon transcriptional repressor [Streptomyces sp. TLI_053]|uniref:GntR family transcriptional regulator n=1 Tax=Streptomyces sp. TLI_053 TaxID=1855352 RepID=UPI00087D7589|nr:GntR family transcriptional regulator [Streptomyces sp. TLI_053]SDT69934.1 GntR family transcriptional regulator, phosphonate transport system regulatory protein/GntR family transcriptional regulator, trehalose operon transcriptional repressor [Streptomyces sp. TLI_053]